MERRSRMKTVALSLLIIHVGISGCHDEKADAAAIRRLLEYDAYVAAQARKIESKEVAEPMLAAAVANMKKAPVDDCPKDFRDAYAAHVAAWEARSSEQIATTWLSVKAAAKLHGVDWSE